MQNTGFYMYMEVYCNIHILYDTLEKENKNQSKTTVFYAIILGIFIIFFWFSKVK